MNEMALKDAIKRLPDREKEIIKLRYFDGKPRWRCQNGADFTGTGQQT